VTAIARCYAVVAKRIECIRRRPYGCGGLFVWCAFITRVIAGCFGTQSSDRPARYGRSRRFDTRPSSSNSHALRNRSVPISRHEAQLTIVSPLKSGRSQRCHSLFGVSLRVRLRVKSGTEPSERDVSVVVVVRESGGLLMTSPASELFFAIVKLAAEQLRFGLVTAEIAASGDRRMASASATEVAHAAVQTPPSFDVEVEAAARVIKDKLLDRRDGGFRNLLRLNFPDDEIREMAEAALSAARAAK
jgi:hypothetical protein